MDPVYFDMLQDLGIPVTEPERALVTPPPPRPKLPTHPAYYDSNGTAVFTSHQISWANPEDFGFDGDYLVVEEEDTAHPLALNWEDEMNCPRKRPVHRYSRKERFKFVLGQLMGCSGHVPPHVLKAMDVNFLWQLGGHQVWEEVRSVLKRNGWRIYYNRIPAILAGLGLHTFKFGNTKVFQDIMHDFELMDRIYGSLKQQFGRSYFPNLRFTAVKLMKRHGVTIPFDIPLARTARKLDALEDIYSAIWVAIEQKQWDDFFKHLLE